MIGPIQFVFFSLDDLKIKTEPTSLKHDDTLYLILVPIGSMQTLSSLFVNVH